MTQQTSPFIEGKYGWALGEGNWNLGMDENLLKFSYLFDRNIDGIVSSLPAAVNGTAYFNTTDNRIYYAAGGIYSSTPVPKWFEVTLRSSGQVYQFDGTSLNLGSTETGYTDALRNDLLNATDITKGAALIGYSGRNLVADLEDNAVNPRRFGAEGDGLGRLLSDKFSTLADAQSVYPFVTTLSDTIDWAGIQAAFNYAAANKYGYVGFPQGRFKTKRKIQSSGYVGTFGQGRGFNVDSGTIIERVEGTGSSDPIFVFGTGNSLPNFYMADMSLIGDTTATTARAIEFNVTGLHKPVLERLHINYVQGTPIYIPTSSSLARPEFLTFRDINVGEDFSGYGGRDVNKARPNDPDCTGLWIRDTSGTDAGVADSISIENCVFLGRVNGFNASISVQARGDILRITATSMAGANRGLEAWTREVQVDTPYFEGLTFPLVLKNNFSSSTKGVKVFSLTTASVSSCRYTINIDDTTSSINSATKGKVDGIFVYSNNTLLPDGHDVVYGVGPNSVIEVSNISTNLSNDGPTTTGCRILRVGMSNADRVQGQVNILRESRRFTVEGLRFPTVPVLSTDLRVLDDYQEIPSWLPELTCTTPGDLSVVYTSRSGKAVKVGGMSVLQFSMVISSVNYTTASGQLKITGLPFPVTGASCPIQAQGVTYAGDGLFAQGITGNPEVFLRRAGSAVSVDYVLMSAIPSGGGVVIVGFLTAIA